MGDFNYFDIDSSLEDDPHNYARPAEDALVERVRPVKPVFVLGNGIRMPIELRFLDKRMRKRLDGVMAMFYVFRPVIEGEVAKVMPMVHSIDADEWHPEAAILLPMMPTKELNAAWSRRVLENSECLKTISVLGKTYRRDQS